MKENGDLPVMKYSPLPLTIVPLQNVISHSAELNMRDKANFDRKTHYQFIQENLTDNGSFVRDVDLLSIDLLCDLLLFNGRFEQRETS